MLQVLGRLHPLLVHFPIALLLAACVAELLARRRDGPSDAGLYCLTLGTLGALAAALSGWLFAELDPPGMDELLFRHRWSGVGVATGATLTLLSAWRWRRSASPALARPTKAGLLLTGLLVSFSGHLGGEMIYGEGFALEPLRGGELEPAVVVPSTSGSAAVGALAESPSPSPVAAAEFIPSVSPEDDPPQQEEKGAEATHAQGTATSAPVDYLSEIRPLFEQHCYECHGDKRRPKGKLRLTDLPSVFARDPSEAALVPGEPGKSLVYQRILLPEDHEDLMPPEGGPLEPEEIELVRRWIAQGASWSEAAESGPAAHSAATTPASPSPSEPDVGPQRIVLTEAQRSARDAALERLRARGAHAMRIAQSDEGVEVDLGLAVPRAGDADLALLAGLEPCLVELSLTRTEVSAAGVVALARFRALRRLRLAHTALGDAALVSLAGLSELESLSLFGTRVTDAGLAPLAGLPRLVRLYTGDTSLGDEALDALERARPNLAIERGHLPTR